MNIIIIRWVNHHINSSYARHAVHNILLQPTVSDPISKSITFFLTRLATHHIHVYC